MTLRPSTTPFLAGILALLSCVAVPEVLPSADNVPNVEFESYKLPNGLNVILHVDRRLPVVHVNEWFHVGAKNEQAGRTGFAHLFEHMMFQGSKNAPGEYFSYAERAGASVQTGGVNGTTSWDRTNYFVTAPSGALEFLLWLESDRIAHLLDELDEEKLQNQKDVVKNERRQRVDNAPYGRAWEFIVTNLFPEGHPYSWPVIGSLEDVQAATLEDVKAFFRKYYTPNNLSLAIAGDFDPEAAKPLIEKYFGTLTTGPALARPRRVTVRLDEEKIIDVADRVPLARTYMVWPTVPFFEVDDALMNIAAGILGDGLSSRLQKLLVYDKQICSSVEANQVSMESTGFFVIEATAREGEALEAIEAEVTAALDRLASEPPTLDEMERTRNKIEFAFVSGLEKIGGFGGKADQLNKYYTYLGDPDRFAEDLQRYRSATPEDIRDAVARYLGTAGRLLVRFHPEESGRPSDVEVDRSATPELAADRPFQVPPVTASKLDNGLSVFVVERHEIPKVALRVVSRAGCAASPEGQEGLTELFFRMLDKGTATHSALELDEAFARLGATRTRSVGLDASTLILEVLSTNLEAAVKLLAGMVNSPTFPSEELERERKKQLDELLQKMKNPTRIAFRIAPKLVFGESHPYGRSITGDKEAIEAFRVADLKDFKERYLNASNLALVWAGDITDEKARALSETFFGKLPKGTPANKDLPGESPATPKVIHLVDRQDAAQSSLVFAFPGLARGSEDYYAMEIANHVLGGAFTSRLNMNLREDKGYTYGADSFVVPYSKGGWFAAYSAVKSAVTSESVREFMREFREIVIERPITEKELDDAKANRVRSYAQSFETLANITDNVGKLWALGRPISDLADQPDRLRDVTLKAANAAVRKYADPSRARILVVGDTSVVEKGLGELGIGPVVRLDEHGRPVE